MEVIVEYDYDKEQEDELSLRVGDIIKNVVQEEGGWWEGELNGKKGMFPENFVKVMKKDASNNPSPVSTLEDKRSAPQRKSVRELASKFKDGLPFGPPQPKKKDKRKKCKVLFDYDPENDDELKLQVGDIVDFIREVEEGWWEGALHTNTGVFPSNFVEMIEDDGTDSGDKVPSTAAPPIPTGGPPSEKEAEMQHGKGGKKVIGGVGLGNIFDGGPIKLRSTTKRNQEADKGQDGSRQNSVDTSMDVALRKDKPPGEKAKVRFSYTASQPDELSLSEGEVVLVLDKHLEDEGWWKGEINGKVGVFPDNFVELLPEEHPKPKKPPPPATPANKPLYPKLPEKSASLDHTHEEKKEPPHTGEKPSVLGSRKPGMAPPVSKKPLPPKPTEVPKPSDPPRIEPKHTDSHSAPAPQEEKLETDEEKFDSLEPTSQKLVHLTANRAKGPKKRPPSAIITQMKNHSDNHTLGTSQEQAEKEAEPEESSTAAPIVKEEPAMAPPEPRVLEKDKRLPDKRPAAIPEEKRSLDTKRHVPEKKPLPDRLKKEPPSSHNPNIPPRPPEPLISPPNATPAVSHPPPGESNAHLVKMVEELQREMRDLRNTSVTKSAYNDLKSECERLRQEMDTLKAAHSKKLRELMMEVDEEKKLRLNTQVEIERIKKLIAETNVNPAMV